MLRRACGTLPSEETFEPRRRGFGGESRALGPQTALTCVQFAAVRELRDALDRLFGASPVNLSLAYGAASVPLIAGKYNLLFADVYRHFQLAPPEAPGEMLGAKLWRQWETKIRPGLLWSYLRDTFSIGGAIVLGPVVAKQMHALVDRDGAEHGRKPGRALQFLSGLLTGCGTGLATLLDDDTPTLVSFDGKPSTIGEEASSALQALGSLAAMAHGQKGWVRQLFVAHDAAAGVYSVRFFHWGWRLLFTSGISMLTWPWIPAKT